MSKDDETRKLGQWVSHQVQNYKKKTKIMKNEEIYNKWTEFINHPKYKEHFISGEDVWIETLSSVVKYIDENNKRPSCHSKDDETRKLGQWVDRQVQNYKKKKEIMKNEEIYNKWTEFINDPKYKEYL
jgi:hypothetical protein